MTNPVSRLDVTLSGRYAMERQLGEGGLASVCLPRDLKHDRRVALEVLKPETRGSRRRGALPAARARAMTPAMLARGRTV